MSPHSAVRKCLLILSMRAQVVADDTPKVKCKRIVSALLPAAELLLRGVMDLRHTHWQRIFLPPPPGYTKQHGVKDVRCTATQYIYEWERSCLSAAKACLNIVHLCLAPCNCSRQDPKCRAAFRCNL